MTRALDSVLAQTQAADEVIVVDDGSTDGTASWLASQYPSHISGITVIAQKNQGVSAARNVGVQNSASRWVAFLDSDDSWFPTKLERQLAALRAAPEMRVCHTDEHWIRRGRRVNPKNKHRKYGGDIFSKCLPLCAMSPSSVIIRRDVFADIGLFDETLPACEDYDLWLRITVGEPVLYIDEALVEKTGGHADQLSQRYPAMDQYRLEALAKLLASGKANPVQQAQALSIFREKYNIFKTGALKRDRTDAVNTLERRFAGWLSD